MRYRDYLNKITEDNLSNVAKKKKAEKADIAKIRNDLQTTKKTVTKRVDGEPDTTTVTITNPETNTTARKVISADPLVPVTDTITTQEIGGDFSSDLTHLGEAAPDPNWNADAEGNQIGYTPPVEKELNGKLVWAWNSQGPHDPANIDSEKHGQWVKVGEWLPRIPAQGGYYTVAGSSEEIQPKHLTSFNKSTNTWDVNSYGDKAPFVHVTGQATESINEDLKSLDLENLVNNTIFVDKHKSKLGEDKDVIVLAMEVKNNDAAKDLMSFIERGYTDVIDADHISSENIDGDYIVFVEFERKDTFKDVLSEMLGGVERLTGIDNWSFKHYKSNRTLTMEELHNTLPVTPEQYDSFLAKEKNIKDQLQQLKINARVPMK